MIVIIPCGAKKRSVKCKAKDLYTGTYFKANWNWARSVTNNIYILSAKYGLLKPDDMVEPYDMYMGSKGSVDISTLKKQIACYNINGSKIYALGGKNYISALRKAGLNVIAPVEGKSMGIQISLLKRNKGKTP